MKNGYYLSVYFSINKLGHVYDYFFRHDQNMSLWKFENGKIDLIKYWELERKTGQKSHYKSFYTKEDALSFIERCLKECNVSINEINEIWGTPELDSNFMSFWDVNKTIADHSINHLYSSLLMDTDLFYNNTIIALAVDGGPDKVIDKNAFNKKFYAGCVSINGVMQFFSIYSPGLLWDHMKHQIGLREGTIMALANACKTTYFINELPNILINNHKSMELAYDTLNQLFDEIKALKAEDIGIKCSEFDPLFSDHDNKISMYAKLVQQISINVMEYNIDSICSKYNLDPQKCILSIAGGYGLNCPTNSYLLHKYKFKDFMAVPCINDSGLSMGIGLRAFYLKSENKLSYKLGSPYHGSCYSDLQYTEKYAEYIDSVHELDSNQWVEDLISYPIIWFDECSEIGPRALGHRSIFADPRNKDSKDILNKVKKREWWRPVAPIVLKEEADEWFDMHCAETPYMLHTCMIKEDKLNLVEAIAHLDNTARVQTLAQENNEILYKLIQEFAKNTKVPIICNTSLNDKGEPIIDTIEQAMNFALRKKIPVIYINQRRIKLKNFENYLLDTPEKRGESNLVNVDPAVNKKLINEINPFGLSSTEVGYLCIFDQMLNIYDLTVEKDVKAIKLFVEKMEKNSPIDISTFFLV